MGMSKNWAEMHKHVDQPIFKLEWKNGGSPNWDHVSTAIAWLIDEGFYPYVYEPVCCENMIAIADIDQDYKTVIELLHSSPDTMQFKPYNQGN